MKPPFYLTRFGAMFFAIIVAVVGNTACSRASDEPRSAIRAPVKAPPVEIKTSSQADERLFLLRLLNHLNGSWPDESLPPERLQTALTSLRQETMDIRNHIREIAVDENLLQAYENFLSTLDAYAMYLGEIGRINKLTVTRTENESHDSGYKAGYAGAAGGYAISDNGGSTGQSLAVAGIAALSTYLWDDYQKGKAREEAKGTAITTAKTKLRDRVTEYLGFCQKTGTALTTKYGWGHGEAGFDEPPAYEATRAGLVQNNNTDGLAQLEETMQAKRPRDPFLIFNKTYFRSLNPNGPIAAQIAAGEECLAAAQLIPKGSYYDGFRVDMVSNAAAIMDRVANREMSESGWGKGFNSHAAMGVQLWDYVLRYRPDITGEIRERKAWDLFKSGDMNSAVAEVTAIHSLRQGNLAFCYNMACLMSDSGDFDTSLDWLRHAIVNLGFNAVKNIKTDPDLAGVRSKFSTQIEELTTVRCTWKINFGTFNDDLVVTNNSPFAITQVLVNGRITPNNKPWSAALNVGEIPAGQSQVWSNAFSVPNSKIDRSLSNLILHCDQGECTPVLLP